MSPVLRRLSVLPLSVGLLVPLGAAASAHVSVQPGTAEKGGYAKVSLRVPTERDSSTVKLVVTMPTEHPLTSVRVKPHVGWSVAVTRGPAVDADTPGLVTALTWTATGGGIPTDQFDEFDLSIGPLPEDVDALGFPTAQTYADGTVVRWADPVVEGAEPEHPTPTLELVEPVSDADSQAGAAATPVALASSTTDDGGVDGLAVGALAVGCVALVVGAGALVLSRRGRPGDSPA